MDQELRTYLDEKFAAVDEKFAAMERRSLDNLHALEEKLTAHFVDNLRDMETKLLTAFHGWGRPMEVRVNGMTTLVLGFEERLGLVEHRVSELERKRLSDS